MNYDIVYNVNDTVYISLNIHYAVYQSFCKNCDGFKPRSIDYFIDKLKSLDIEIISHPNGVKYVKAILLKPEGIKLAIEDNENILSDHERKRLENLYEFMINFLS